MASSPRASRPKSRSAASLSWQLRRGFRQHALGAQPAAVQDGDGVQVHAGQRVVERGGRIANVDQLRVFRANMPFLWGMLGFLILIMAFPQLATWLPSLLRN